MMKRLKFWPAFAFLLSPLLASAADATWVNNASITVAPQIDATNVVNNGLIDIFTSAPFDTSNTRNFTNTGTMNGSVGFRFDRAPRNSNGQLIGQRVFAENFHNRFGAVVTAVDGILASGTFGSYLLVQATNVVNQGLLTVGPAGLLQVTGTNLNLAFGRAGIDGIGLEGQGSANGNTNFLPDIAVYDNYWGQTNDTFNTTQIMQFFGPYLIAISPPHRVAAPGGAAGDVQVAAPQPFLIGQPFTGAYSNAVGGIDLNVTNDLGLVTNVFVVTNEVRQAAFIGTSDLTNYLASVRFYPSAQQTNPMQTVAIELVRPITNQLSGVVELHTTYFIDTLASSSNRGTLLNVQSGTRKPANYLVSRLPEVEYVAGAPGNVALTNGFLYETNFGAATVTGEYAGYSAFLDAYANLLPPIPAGDLTNLQGRVEIQGHNVNLAQTRLRSEGYLSVKAGHLISSTNAILDCENLNLDVASTNGLLTLQNLVKGSVQRVRGDIYAWSAVWTNAYTTVLSNYNVDTNGLAEEAFITNVTSMRLHAVILDASRLLSSFPVAVHGLTAKATNVVMQDNGTVVGHFRLDGESFTINGGLTLANAIQDWTSALAPTLRRFTNNGFLTIPNDGHFGDDTVVRYQTFVNRGTISSVGQTIDSDYVELAGTNLVLADLQVMGGDGTVQKARLATGGDINFSVNTLKLNRALLQAAKGINFNVPGSLLDNGPLSSNTLSCQRGFVLPTKPATGDLLGTAVESIALIFEQPIHTWAGLDQGAFRSGYSNNVALGRLKLTPQAGSYGFYLTGAGVSNAIYVDVLDLTLLADLDSQLFIDPSLTIYYAAVKVGFVPPNDLTPEEFLNDWTSLYGGKLRWVSEYAGPGSAVDVVVNGNQTIKVNRALRDSKIIDSDNDGVPNYFDYTPFDGVIISAITLSASPAGVQISWNAAPQTVYRLECSHSFNSTNWVPVVWATNSSASPARLSVVDPNPGPTGAARYYRVTYNPSGF